MKIIYAFILLIVVSCWNSYAIASEESPQSDNGLAMRVFSNKNTFGEKDRMPIWLEIQNKSHKQYSIIKYDFGIINFFSVFDSQGKRVSYSPKTQEKLTPSVVVQRRSLEFKIPAGTSKKIEVTSNLLKSIDIKKSGEYSYCPTVFLYHMEGGRLNVKVQRVQPFNFSFKGNGDYNESDVKSLNKLIELKFEQQEVVSGLKIKSIRINRKVLDDRNDNSRVAELFVEIKNVSKDKFPAFQWFGRYDMILWDSKVFHNQKIIKHELFDGFKYFLNLKGIKYHFWYDVISPGETRSFKIILNPDRFPENISENTKFIDLNGSWDFIFSRKVYLVENGKYNTIEPSELLKYEKKLILPKISLTLKEWRKIKVLGKPVIIYRDNN